MLTTTGWHRIRACQRSSSGAGGGVGVRLLLDRRKIILKKIKNKIQSVRGCTGQARQCVDAPAALSRGDQENGEDGGSTHDARLTKLRGCGVPQ